MKKHLFFSLVVLLVSLGASAQNVPDPAYKNTLLKMFTVSGTDESYKAAISEMINLFKAQNPSVPADVWTEFQAQFLKTSLSDLADMLAPVYQKYLTTSDLEDIISFYSTPTGKKFAKSTPQIMTESMQVGQQWGMKLAQEIQKTLEEKGY